jgi:hypothetical protein
VVEVEVVRCSHVPPKEPLCEVRPLPIDQVHRQEGHVGCSVDPPEVVAKLEAVDQQGIGRIRLEPDVLQVEISVAVDETARGPARIEALRVLLEGLVRPRRGQVEKLPRHDVGVRLERSKVRDDRIHDPCSIERPPGRESVKLVEPGDPLGHGVDVPALQLPQLQHRQGVAPIRQPAHHDAVLWLHTPSVGLPELFADGSHNDAVAAFDQRGHAEVDVGCQAAVQSDLPEAVGVPCLTRRKVDEPQVYPLAHLVDAIAREEHVGEVCLYLFDAPARAPVLGVGRRVGERGKDCGRERLHGPTRYAPQGLPLGRAG